MKCPICNNDKENKVFLVKEMQMGLREEFEYVECSNCKCLFIKDIPENIEKYYANDYAPHQNNNNNNNIINKVFQKIAGLYIANTPLINLIPSNKISIQTNFWKNMVSKNIINKNSSILDVGCGSGKFLSLLKKGGFKDLTGIDLFVDDEHVFDGIEVIQTSLEDFQTSKKFDVIFSNHSFEHMENPIYHLKCYEKLLKEEGLIIIRIPIKSKPFWEKYGVNWFAVDAPRHFFLYTIESFKILVSKTNLIVEDFIFDSSVDQFLSSEKYKKGISMRDPEWYSFKIDKNVLKEFEYQTEILDKNKEGNEVMIILRLKS